MYYFDNSATTKPYDEVLDVFNKYAFYVARDEDFLGCGNEIKKLFNCKHDVFFTSGSSESNNLAIKGIAFKYLGQRKHIISTKTEHSSITETLNYLESLGFIIDYVDLKSGIVDIESLKKLITSDTILVTISSVNSETGVIQPIDEIGKILKKHNICFHSDMTQSIGKMNIPFDNVDLVSFSGHKIHGLKGIGCLLANNIQLEPIIYGKQLYNLGLIKSFVKALEISLVDVDVKFDKVKVLKEQLVSFIKNQRNLHINNEASLPYILNISVNGIKPETFIHKLEEYNIYCSTRSACSSNTGVSNSVYYLTCSFDYAKNSIRFSLSPDMSSDDISYLGYAIKEILGGGL